MMIRNVAVLILSSALLPTVALAQRNQPIYPVYDGFVKNADGTYTLAFGYFSHNAEVVSVPPGPENTFAPEPGDRQQPVTFKPGHWRFQCVMVVNADVAGKTRWTLSYAGTSTGTSERMLQSNWNLVEGAAEIGRIDIAKAPRGVCLNRAPVVRIWERPRAKEWCRSTPAPPRNCTCLAACKTKGSRGRVIWRLRGRR